MKTRLFCGKLINPGIVKQDAVVEICDRKIASVDSHTGMRPGAGDIDLAGLTVIPGLIDIHIHGAKGDDFSLGNVECAAAYLASRGTTSFLATPLYATQREACLEALHRLRQMWLENRQGGARMLGIHLEGPFLNPEHGSQAPEACWPLTKENLDDVLTALGDALKMVSLSPELAGAAEAVRRFSERNICTAATHTCANAEEMQAVYDAGLRHVTHILNAMPAPPEPEGGKGIRTVGCAEYAMASKDMTADCVVDSGRVHLAQPWLRILFQCMGTERLTLISDAVPVAGMGEGSHPLADGRSLQMKPGQDVAFIKEKETDLLCGSVMMMLDAVRNVMHRVGLSLQDTIRLATLNPATLLGIDTHKGTIEPGKDADLVALDDQMQVVLTMVEGEVVYQANQ